MKNVSKVAPLYGTYLEFTRTCVNTKKNSFQWPKPGSVLYTRNVVVYGLAPPTLGTSGMFHDNRVCYHDTDGFTTDQLEIRCI